jgi:hypothetical protein
VSTEYSGRSLNGKTLAVILPDSSHAEARNPADVWACFPRERPYSANTILSQEFRDAFLVGLDRYLDYAKPIPVPDSAAAAPDSQSLTWERAATSELPGYTYRFPSRAHLASQGIEADMALVVAQVRSSGNTEDFIAPKFGGTVQQTRLLVDGQYLIWDYAGNKPIGYGRFRAEIDYKHDMDLKDWQLAFDKAVKKIIDASPFKGPKWIRS